MKKLTLITAIFVMVTLLSMSLTALAAGSQSITRTFQPSSADTYIDANAPDISYGSDTTMNVKSKSAQDCRSLMQFDISTIPSGSSVSSASLQLYLGTAPSADRTHDVHRVTSTWADTVTWNTVPAFNGTATASNSTGTTDGVWLSWGVTADVSAYVGGTATNYGWIVKDSVEGKAGGPVTGSYATANETTESLRPKLSVTFTPLWDSYSDTARTIGCDSFSGSTNVVYMKGTGFLDAGQTYNVSYYDAGNNKIATDSNIALVGVSDSRGTLGNTGSPYEPAYDFTNNLSASPGTWHVVAQPYGATAFPSSYSDLSTAPDTYELIADDIPTVAASAIPEFPTVISAIAIAGLCCGIYFWMRRRYRRVEVRIQ